MDELRNMRSRVNSWEGVKEKYDKGILEAYDYILNHYDELIRPGFAKGEATSQIKQQFGDKQFNECVDNSLGSNYRWGIVSLKNFFGLEAVIYPEEVYESRELPDFSREIYLKANAGRFQPNKFNGRIFPKLINISEILDRENAEDYFEELKMFYNMTNRQFFEKFGVFAEVGDDANLIANCVVLDSLLQGRHGEMEDVYCHSTGGRVIEIKLADGTQIFANTNNRCVNSEPKGKGITIKKDGKEARVEFDAISMGERSDLLASIDDLEVENVVYSGEPELIAQLQQAMQEQFKSQQREDDKNKTSVLGKFPKETVESKIEQPTIEKTGAEAIIDFMKQHNLGFHDLTLALSMTVAKTTDITNAEQQIINDLGIKRENPENSISEH